MDKDLFRFLADTNPWWSDADFRYDVIDRPTYLARIDLSQRYIEVLLGARRVGKTSIMESLTNRLLSNDTPPEQVLFLTADNPFLAGISLGDIITKYLNRFELSMTDEVYVFVDEIQDIEDWQLVLKYYYDNSQIKFVVSGSSSQLINQQAKKLTGRIDLHTVWTLSWGETPLFSDNYSLDKYLDLGGYPEVVLGVKEPRQSTLQIVESTVYRDLIGLYGIQNPKKLIDLIRILTEKVGTAVSFRSLARQLDIDDSTAKKLIEYLTSIKLIFELPLYTISTKKALRNPSKYYFLDNGIISCFALNRGEGILAENLVATHLAQKYSKTGVNHGYTVQNGQEIDFAYGNDRYEVKYRDGWQSLIDMDTDQKITVITKADHLADHPFITAVPLDTFLTLIAPS